MFHQVCANFQKHNAGAFKTMTECKYCGCEIPEKSYYIEACVGCIFGPIDYLEKLCDIDLKEKNEKNTDYSSLRWVNGDGSTGD